MERLGPINRDRLQWCSDDFGISPEDVGAQIHVAPSRWQAVLDGEDGLTFPQVRSLADFFGRGVLFFLEAGSVDVQKVRTPAFRSVTDDEPHLSPDVKTLIERVERYRQIYLAMLEEIGEGAPVFTPPGRSDDSDRVRAEKVRAWLDLEGDASAERSFAFFRERVERRGVLVVRTPGYAGDWKIPNDSSVIGFSLYFETCPVIVVRAYPAESRMTFTLMHELGHLVLHGNGSIDHATDLYARKGGEKDANAFAGHVLVPQAMLGLIPDRAIPKEPAELEDSLRHWYGRWGVSAEVVLRRLLDVGRLTIDEYQRYRDWKEAQRFVRKGKGNRAGRYKEPVKLFGRSYVRAVLTALRGRRITLNKACGYLDNLKVKDVFRLEKHVAGL